ncbi:uncharacterized protein LOC135168912 [Diachasmimorpha longicaudata]|uniref:uncharacterized protein LOC135168912 n=1 Tax=Diachasmimorpha longicaudata TaxID=58733 RepID=UPI0030B8EED2
MEVVNDKDTHQFSQMKNLPEGIGEAEDSGFASIAAAERPQNDDQGNLEEQAQIKREKQLAARRLRQEAYNEEKRQNTYKRLMHLVSRSKFYSDFLVKKLNREEDPVLRKRPKRVKNPSRRQLDDDVVASQKARTDKLRYQNDLRKIVSTEMKEKFLDQRGKFNSNQDDLDLGVESVENSEKVFITPKYFTGELRDYQQEGLKWLKALYENGMSGILADEMGLGKTVQVIAMIAHLIEKKQGGPYLVLAPLSTIPNWLLEFERFAPKIPVVFYYGDKEERSKLAKKMKAEVNIDGFKTQPVILTTYEVPLKDKFQLRRQHWRYLVVDEGQRIKNAETRLSLTLQEYKSMNRLLLTGTPLQNDMQELWSLLHFLMPDIFDDLAVFESWLDCEDFQSEAGTDRFLKQEEEKQVLQSFRDILKPFMVRRLKADVCLDIPPKKEVLVYAPMTKLQHNLYSGLLNYDLEVFSKRKADPLVVDDEFGNRPKRKCAYNNKYSGVYKDPYRILSSSTSSSSAPATSELLPEISQMPKKVQEDLEILRQCADVTQANSYYFMRLAFGNRGMMYRKIIDHPYLIHYPLDSGLPQIDEELIKASGKMMVLDRMLQKLHKGGHRILLFSISCMMLDILEDYLMMRPWKYRRLDGNTDIADRKESIQIFNSDPDYFLFLVSTRAGGIGLNLTGADTVILYDSDWNPQADIQAMARCHRIGQTKPVVIYRLCTKGSYDERIVQRAESKRTLEKLVISKEIDEIKFTKDGLMKLKQLLDSSNHQTVDSAADVFTEKELDKLLDRSDLIAQMKKKKSEEFLLPSFAPSDICLFWISPLLTGEVRRLTASDPSNLRITVGGTVIMEFLTGEGHQEPVIKGLPEGVESEDSGVGSIVSIDTPENELTNFDYSPTNEVPSPEEQAHINAQVIVDKRKDRTAARLLQEQQNEEKRQNTYNRLLHLVSRSKFYSDLFAQKLRPEGSTESQTIVDSEKSPNPEEFGSHGRSRKRSAVDTGDVPAAKRVRSGAVEEEIAEEAGELNTTARGDLEEKKVFVPLKYFRGDLRDYQQEGLQWLKALYKNGMGGILADEMGLGKTVQAIAMIAHLLELKQPGPYLVLAPLSTTPNWLAEFERFSPEIPVVFLHGSRDEREKLAKKMKRPVIVDGFTTQPVVLTTYEVAVRDKEFLISQTWTYLVVDEGQRLKNSKSLLSQIMQEIKSTNRLLLTGTPLQNDLKELWSLLHFLMPDIFDDLAVFESWFNSDDFRNEERTNRFLKQEEDKKVLQSFREILRPFMLRRLKSDVCLDIPPKKEVLVYAPMSQLQHDLYSALLNQDLESLAGETMESLIVDDEFGNRPKRKCLYNNPYSGVYMGSPGRNISMPSSPRTPQARKELPEGRNTPVPQKRFRAMKRYGNVTDENSEYFSKISMKAHMMTYKKVINHPYMIHDPTEEGYPINQDVIKLSGKFMVLDKMLNKLHKDGHRVLLFSTLTMLLDVIEKYLTLRPWKYRRLDGSTDVAARKESIELFNKDPQYFLFLISTRAGGVGLNLMGADTVIIFDSDFNPQVDIQAMARCHRIGQTKPVVIYKLCTKGSYDEAIVNRAQAKRKLEMLVISKEIEDMKFNREGLFKLKQLLQASEHQSVDSEKDVFTEEELNRLLDRSDLVEQMERSGGSGAQSID